MRILALAAVVACSCTSSSKPPAVDPVPQPVTGGTRTPLLSKDDPRFEGPTFKNACGADGDCHVGGCSGEVCTAEEGVITTCVVHADQPRGASCGCVAGSCVWYTPAEAAPPPGPAGGGAAQGEPCPEGKCSEGLTCLTYYGIAGPSGPAFTSCEIPCLKGASCPSGQECITIADGPGQVCRPKG
jgi:eight-cysteine-cluster-containing protein